MSTAGFSSSSPSSSSPATASTTAWMTPAAMNGTPYCSVGGSAPTATPHNPSSSSPSSHLPFLQNSNDHTPSLHHHHHQHHKNGNNNNNNTTAGDGVEGIDAIRSLFRPPTQADEGASSSEEHLYPLVGDYCPSAHPSEHQQHYIPPHHIHHRSSGGGVGHHQHHRHHLKHDYALTLGGASPSRPDEIARHPSQPQRATTQPGLRSGNIDDDDDEDMSHVTDILPTIGDLVSSSAPSSSTPANATADSAIGSGNNNTAVEGEEVVGTPTRTLTSLLSNGVSPGARGSGTHPHHQHHNMHAAADSNSNSNSNSVNDTSNSFIFADLLADDDHRQQQLGRDHHHHHHNNNNHHNHHSTAHDMHYRVNNNKISTLTPLAGERSQQQQTSSSSYCHSQHHTPNLRVRGYEGGGGPQQHNSATANSLNLVDEDELVSLLLPSGGNASYPNGSTHGTSNLLAEQVHHRQQVLQEQRVSLMREIQDLVDQYTTTSTETAGTADAEGKYEDKYGNQPRENDAQNDDEEKSALNAAADTVASLLAGLGLTSPTKGGDDNEHQHDKQEDQQRAATASTLFVPSSLSSDAAIAQRIQKLQRDLAGLNSEYQRLLASNLHPNPLLAQQFLVDDGALDIGDMHEQHSLLQQQHHLNTQHFPTMTSQHQQHYLQHNAALSSLYHPPASPHSTTAAVSRKNGPLGMGVPPQASSGGPHNRSAHHQQAHGRSLFTAGSSHQIPAMNANILSGHPAVVGGLTGTGAINSKTTTPINQLGVSGYHHIAPYTTNAAGKTPMTTLTSAGSLVALGLSPSPTLNSSTTMQHSNPQHHQFLASTSHPSSSALFASCGDSSPLGAGPYAHQHASNSTNNNSHTAGNNNQYHYHINTSNVASSLLSVETNIRGRVYEIARDQHGCRYLQRVLDVCVHQQQQQQTTGANENRNAQNNSNNAVSSSSPISLNRMSPNSQAVNSSAQNLFSTACSGNKSRAATPLLEGESNDANNTSNLHNVILSLILEETIPHVADLMTDQYANFLIQKLFDIMTPAMRYQVSSVAGPHLSRIALTPHGTFSIQKLIETIATPEEMAIITESLQRDVTLLVKDVHGNHVIQKVLQRFDEADKQFIYDAMSTACLSVATNKQGCCVLQRCLEYAGPQQRAQLVQAIVVNSASMVQDPFGNYVVQYVLEQGDMEVNDAIATSLLGTPAPAGPPYFLSGGDDRRGERKAPASGHAETQKVDEQNISPDELPHGGDNNKNAEQEEPHPEVSLLVPLCMNKFSSNVVEKMLRVITSKARELYLQYLIHGDFAAVTEALTPMKQHMKQQNKESNVPGKPEGENDTDGKRERTAHDEEASTANSAAPTATNRKYDVLARVLSDEYGNYVVQTALSVALPKDSVALAMAMRPIIPSIRHAPYCKKLEAKVDSILRNGGVGTPVGAGGAACTSSMPQHTGQSRHGGHHQQHGGALAHGGNAGYSSNSTTPHHLQGRSASTRVTPQPQHHPNTNKHASSPGLQNQNHHLHSATSNYLFNQHQVAATSGMSRGAPSQHNQQHTFTNFATTPNQRLTSMMDGAGMHKAMSPHTPMALQYDHGEYQGGGVGTNRHPMTPQLSQQQILQQQQLFQNSPTALFTTTPQSSRLRHTQQQQEQRHSDVMQQFGQHGHHQQYEHGEGGLHMPNPFSSSTSPAHNSASLYASQASSGSLLQGTSHQQQQQLNAFTAHANDPWDVSSGANLMLADDQMHRMRRKPHEQLHSKLQSGVGVGSSPAVGNGGINANSMSNSGHILERNQTPNGQLISNLHPSGTTAGAKLYQYQQSTTAHFVDGAGRMGDNSQHPHHHHQLQQSDDAGLLMTSSQGSFPAKTGPPQLEQMMTTPGLY